MQVSFFKQNYSIVIVICLMFFSCQSTVVQVTSTEHLLYDKGFEGYAKVEVETEDQVFHLDRDAKAFVEQTLATTNDRTEQMEALISRIFSRSELNLLYSGHANTVANETFRNRAANCLSMSVMTYALATEAGFDVDFQEIIIPEYWTRRAGFSLLNGHINLKIKAPKEHNIHVFNPRSFQVDFDPQSSRQGLPKKLVSKQNILSMFYNNKGADALIKQDYLSAYSYFRHAVELNPKLSSAWVNLGILYRKKEYFPQAEKSYLNAIKLNPNSLTAWENLAYLYRFTGNANESESILARVDKKRNNNPYYHVNLGEQEMERLHWDQALSHFKKALALDKNKHEVYFGLARAYFAQGEIQQSERYLKLAKNRAKSQQAEELYQSKLDFIKHL